MNGLPRFSVLFGLAFLFISTVSSDSHATEAPFLYKACIVKMIYWQGGEPKMKDKRKYNQVVVDGLNPDQLDYIFIPGRPISLGTTVISSLARDVVEKNKLEKNLSVSFSGNIVEVAGPVSRKLTSEAFERSPTIFSNL